MPDEQQPKHLEYEMPEPDEGPTNPPRWATLSATKESDNWGTLDQIKAQNDARWLTAYGWVLVVLTGVFVTCFTAALLIWVWHYLSPACWHWLSDVQLSKVQSVLFSGGMGAIISGIIRAQLGKTQ